MLRFTTADRGRKGSLTVDGTKIADITVAESVAGSENGFYNAEFPLPAAVAVNKDGTPKEKFVVKLTASSSTLIPGLYYVRLLGDKPEQGTTAVNAVSTQPRSTDYYTLGGVKVDRPGKGVYISNGRKKVKR